MTDSIPYGLCHCGCGQRTRISDRTHTRYGYVRGQPRKFVRGHCGTRPGRHPYAAIEPPNPSGLCLCGCGMPTMIAKKTVSEHGWLKGHAKAFLQGHRADKPYRLAITASDYLIEDRGHATLCWVMLQAPHPDGHVQIKLRGERKAQWAHRVMWEQERGPIPEGYDVHHLCEQPPCVNPEHLLAVPHDEHPRLHRG